MSWALSTDAPGFQICGQPLLGSRLSFSQLPQQVSHKLGEGDRLVEAGPTIA